MIGSFAVRVAARFEPEDTVKSLRNVEREHLRDDRGLPGIFARAPITYGMKSPQTFRN